MNRGAENPLVSVLIPVYNGEHLLAAALESVLTQTYRAREVIVVDDGSTDDSKEIVRGLQGVRYFYQTNQGTGAARNAGVQLARGEYFAFLDQDDVWLADKLAFQVDYMKSHPQRDGVFGSMAQFRAGAPPEARRAGKKMDGYSPSALLVKRDSFRRAGQFATDLEIGEWADWYLRAIEQGLTFGMPERLVALRGVHVENKGFVRTARRHEYAQLLGASLARRRRARVAMDGGNDQ